MHVGQLFPEKVRVKLPISYYAHINLDGVGGGTPGGHFWQKGFGLNNLFNWDSAITAHQPRGFNQWAAMFDLCYVVSQKVMTRLTPISGNTVTNEVTGILVTYLSRLGTAEITGSSQYYDDLERIRDPDLNAKWGRFSGGNAGSGYAGPLTKVTNKFYTRDGYTDADLATFTFATDGTAAPVVQREFHVYVRCPVMALNEQLLVEVTSTVDCIFFSPKNIIGS